MPRCSSTRVVAPILADHARAVCETTVAVRAEARAARARQTSQTLILSDNARIRSTPQLDILANEVECSQRTVVRRLEDAAAVYARARGMSDEAARSAAVLAFAGEALSRIRREPFGDAISDLVRTRTEQVLEGTV